ncbi:MAG: hypothetical protein U0514_04005 [Candidatus Andersenbacteria bacterium]
MTTHVVSDEQLGQLTRRQNDLFRRVREGTLPVDKVLVGLQHLIEGNFGPNGQAAASSSAPVDFKYDKRKDGWKLLEDVGFEPVLNESLIGKLKAVSFHKKGEDYVNGEEMVVRGRELHGANLGQKHAEWLLDNQHLIPKQFRDKWLVFTRTIWLVPDSDRYVCCLYWGVVGWYLGFRWLRDDWLRGGRLLVLGE